MNPPGLTRRTALLAAGCLFLLVLAPIAARADAIAQSCADCCKLACIEAEILKARYQRQEYQKLSGLKNLTEQGYKDAEARMGAIGERFRVVAADGLDTCNYYIPTDQSTAEQRKFVLAGFKVRRDAQGRPLPGDYTLSTDPLGCGANSAAIDLAPLTAPCKGIGDAQVRHEMRHVEECCKRNGREVLVEEGTGWTECGPAPAGRTPRPLTPAQRAADEVPGYDTEIAALEKLRTEAAQACTKESCKRDQEDWDKSADRLGFLIKGILAAAGIKPPSNSPLARGKGGK